MLRQELRAKSASDLNMANVITTGSLHKQPETTCPLLATVFAKLDDAGISYCLLRDYDKNVKGSIDGDVDLLVAPNQCEHLQYLLEQLGFVMLARWGQSPHHFFIGYDAHSDCWIKLDVVTELAYGRPIPALRTTLAVQCLRNARRRGWVVVLSSEDEFITLLLHCLLDKGAFKLEHQLRLVALAHEIGASQTMESQIARYFPPSVSWTQIEQAIMCGDWEILLQTRCNVAACLVRRDPLGTYWRRFTRRALRFLDRRTRSMRSRGLIVALLAPDGAGKTTLAQSLCRTFYLPTRSIYMGTNPSNSTMVLPMTRWLTRLHGSKDRHIIRAMSALNRVIEQAVRYRIGAYHRRRGRLVICDRYPSNALRFSQSGSTVYTRLRQWVEAKLCPPPDMLIYLDAPAKVLYQRKQQHSPELLEQQRQRYLQLVGGLPQTVVVDAQQEPDLVRRAVTATIWRHYVDSAKR